MKPMPSTTKSHRKYNSKDAHMFDFELPEEETKV